jgi:hypothetical protein
MSDDMERGIIRKYAGAAPSALDEPAEPASPAEGEQPQPIDPSTVADRIWTNR